MCGVLLFSSEPRPRERSARLVKRLQGCPLNLCWTPYAGTRTPGIHLLRAEWPFLGKDRGRRKIATITFKVSRGKALWLCWELCLTRMRRRRKDRAHTRSWSLSKLVLPGNKQALLLRLSITLSLPAGRTDLYFSIKNLPALGSPRSPLPPHPT